jgi:L-seryl-tRNA(Ser) seleniumtransferase
MAPANPLRALPQVQRVLETSEAGRLVHAFSRQALVEALRTALGEAREALRRGEAAPSPTELVRRAAAVLAAGEQPGLRRVINAAGVVLHTNLGRSPLPPAAIEAMTEAGAGYANLEFDLDRGERGGRGQAIEPQLCSLLGAEASLAVNNAAAAVLLALSAHAAGGEVIVSRGELVEIGGGFRVPEVIAQGGARLVEVGTTNKTRLDDYRRAITERTRVLLKVHQSNYRVVGFTAEAALPELAGLARERGLVLMHDLGSGALVDLAGLGRAPEPRPQDSLAAGADLVAFSGDKLMGGPQAGLLAGSRAAIEPLRRHPLLRAVRLDKTTLAGLEATLRLYRHPDRAVREIPALRMLAQKPEEVEARAHRLLALIAEAVPATVERSTAQTGGGALPGQEMDSFCVALEARAGDLEALAGRLRTGRPAVVGRLAGGRLLLDLFAVADAEVEALAGALIRAAKT